MGSDGFNRLTPANIQTCEQYDIKYDEQLFDILLAKTNNDDVIKTAQSIQEQISQYMGVESDEDNND